MSKQPNINYYSKSQENGKPLSGGRYISSYFTGDSKSNWYVFTNCLESNDVYCTLEWTIDTTKYVKPISVAQTEEAKIDKSGAFTQKDVDKIIRNYDGKMKTLTTYSYYESSNGEWVKATVAVDNIKDHPKDKIEVIFTERTLDVFLKDIGAKKDEIYHFGWRKLHRYIVPEKCRWVVKNDGVYVSLKKKSKEDHWWSFFKAKATGEEDSDIEEQKKSK